MQIHEVIRFSRRWVPIALVLAIVAAAASYGFTKTLIQKEYTSTVTLEVQSGLGLAGAGNTLDPYNAQQLAQTEAAVAEQYTTVNGAYDLVKRTHPDDFKPVPRASSVSCSPALLTTLFSCTVNARTPRMARDLANAIATVFVQRERQFDASRFHSLLSRILNQEKTALAQHNSTEYLSLAQTEAQVRLSAAAQQNTIRVTAPAALPVNPSSPHPTLNGLIAFFVMLFLGLGVGGVIYATNDSLRSDDELKELTGLPILGFIPYISNLKGKSKTAATLVSAHEPRSGAAEAFRVVRTNVAFTRMDQPMRTLLVTSALQDEGKSTVAANLALAFAESGKRTILVDLDLHRPAVARIFDAPRQGLTNLLLQPDADLETYLLPGPVPNLQILPSGPLPPNPSEQISSPRMREILRRLNAIADLVIVDSPPILALADAAIAASLCDGAVLVCRPDRLNRRAVKRLMEIVSGAGMPVTGIVVNSVTPRSDGYYYSYYSYYGYRYGYGPDEKGKPSKNGHSRDAAAREEIKS